MKKLFVLCLAAIMLLCACGGANDSTEPPEDEGPIAPLEFDIGDAGRTYIKGIGEFTGTDLVIPSKTEEGKSVSYIGKGAFKDCTNLVSITIPANIIASYDTFEGCTSLERFEVKSDNREFLAIDGVLYRNPTTLIRLERYPSAKAGTTYVVPEGIQYIASCAFEGCSLLNEISLPDTLEGILDRVFANCENLTTIKFAGTMERWEAINSEDWRDHVSCTIVCSDGTLNG